LPHPLTPGRRLLLQSSHNLPIACGARKGYPKNLPLRLLTQSSHNLLFTCGSGKVTVQPFLLRVNAALSHQPPNPAANCPLYSGRICRISAKFFESTTEHITPQIFVLFNTNDRRFLQQNSEEAREDRICTEGCSPHRPVLLCFHAVCERDDGSHAPSVDEEYGWRRRRKASSTAHRGPVPGIVFLYHRFREIFFGRPGRYDLTRLF